VSYGHIYPRHTNRMEWYSPTQSRRLDRCSTENKLNLNVKINEFLPFPHTELSKSEFEIF